MKNFLFLGIVIITILGTVSFLGVPEADAALRVRGYYRKNGTYVQPYYRSDPDRYRWNNYSSRYNFNPYTGRKGYRNWYP